MSSYDKVVKLACKPKAAPPKAKYIDPIIAATWSDDGAVSDVCKALSPRFREPNAIVVFKALIVLHTMIRNGATDNVLSYLSQTEILRLRNVSAGNWEGYAAPENLQNYALYLDSRIRAYRDLKHDAVRVQAETNRDMRNSASIEEDSYYNNKSRKDRTVKAPALSGPSRSKTIAGRKLRVMTVEKGLLRETKAVHNMIDTLVECRFYLDDLEDELTITALGMLVKDLLILFQAGNEGVINVLEHYFEMSHVDAEQALNLYRHFCKQTERVVEYLGVAKKLQNLLNVPIPNLKHAPVSLAGALKEYLDDPNFEQNRGEYKANKAATKTSKKPLEVKGLKPSSATAAAETSSSASSSSQASQSTTTNGSASTTTERDSKDKKDMVDFFSAIEEEQPTMDNPQTNSPNAAYFQQQVASNPFAQMGFAPQPQIIPQQTGFMIPQHTAIQQPPNPFNNLLGAPQPQPTGHRPFSSFLQPLQQQQPGFPLQPQQTGFPQQPQQTGFPQQPQQTGFPQQPQQTSFQQQQTGFPQQPQTGFLRQPQQRLLLPQSTGANPFRQSMLLPQSTGAALFTGAATAGSQSFFPNPTPQPPAGPNAFGAMTPFGNSGPHSATAPSINGSADPSINVPQRPASTPLIPFASSSATSPPPAQFVKTHQTGTKNPFGPITTPAPPVPKPPTLMELAMGANSPSGASSFQAFQQQQQSSVQSQPANGFSLNSGALSPGATDISSIASSFTSVGKPSANTTDMPPSLPSFTSLGPLFSQNTSTTTTGSTFSDSLFSSYSQATGATTASSASSPVSPPLKSHLTGLKPFKPSSSFGASLLESLPPIPGSAPVTPGTTGAPNPGGNASLGNSPAPTTSGFGMLSSQPTGATGGFGTPLGGSTLGAGLRPQMTGGGGANPFRASMMGLSTTSPGAPSFGSSFPNMTSYNPTGFPSGAFGSQSNFGGPAQQQQNASLI